MFPMQNPTINYAALATLFKQNALALTPAEVHGLLSGMICGGNQDSSWQVLLYDLANNGQVLSVNLLDPIKTLYQSINNSLEEGEFMFRLLLPDDDASAFAIADALSGWVNHFLLGLGVIQPKLDKVTGDVGEAVADLRNIALLGYNEDDVEEELAQSLEEIIEYVRVAAILCYDYFAPIDLSSNDEPVLPPSAPPPTLH